MTWPTNYPSLVPAPNAGNGYGQREIRTTFTLPGNASPVDGGMSNPRPHRIPMSRLFLRDGREG